MGMWWKNGQIQAGVNNVRLFTVGVDGNHECGFLMEFVNPGDDIWAYSYDGSQKINILKSGITKNQWHHLVMTWDTTGATLYLDGVPAGTQVGNMTIALGATPTGYIGRYIANNQYNPIGLMYEPFIYNVKLTQAQVLGIMNQSSYPTSGLVARWNLNDGGGTSAVDASGNGHTGTLEGTAVFSPDSPFGARLTPRAMSGCVNSLGAVNEKITFTRSTQNNTQGLTFLAWVRTGDTRSAPVYAGNAANNVIGDSTGAVGTGFGVESGKATYHVFTSSWQTIQSPGFIADNRWHLIGVTHTGSGMSPANTVTIYVDGVAVKTVGSTTFYNLGGVDSVGSGYQAINGDEFKGQIAEVAVFNSVLTSAQILTYYQSGLFPSQPQIRFKMQDGSGTVVVDSGTAANNGTLALMTWATSGPFALRPVVT